MSQPPGPRLTSPSIPGRGAGKSWFESTRGQVYRHAYRLMRNRHDAEDLTQDVFVRAFRALPNYRPEGSFRGWLQRITTNLFRDHLRRTRRLRFEPLGDDTDRIITREPTPADLVDNKVLSADVAAALRALSPHFRAAVLLSDVHGMSYAEVANALGSTSERSEAGCTAAEPSSELRWRTGQGPRWRRPTRWSGPHEPPATAADDRWERVTGIEPAWPAWKAGALPLSYTRVRPRARFSPIAGSGPRMPCALRGVA